MDSLSLYSTCSAGNIIIHDDTRPDRCLLNANFGRADMLDTETMGKINVPSYNENSTPR